MLAFFGQEHCLVDGAGRIRLTQRLVEDFQRICKAEVVIHGLPEGAIALYPESVYHDMRAKELQSVDQLAGSFAARRSLRRFGALTLTETISRQGRITLPAPFLQYAGLLPGAEACVVGVEVGVEIWNAERFAVEMNAIQEHLHQLSIREMEAELNHQGGSE